MALGWKKDYLRYKSFFLNVLAIYKQRTDLHLFSEILLSLITILLFGIFALRPTLLTIAQLVKDIRGKEATLALMDQKINSLNRARAILAENEVEIQILEKVVPQIPEPDTLIRQIEGLISQNSVRLLGLSFDAINLKDQSSPEANPALNFSLSLDGNYQTLSNLSRQLSQLRIPVRLDASKLNVIKTATAKSLNLIVSGQVPYLSGTNEKD